MDNISGLKNLASYDFSGKGVGLQVGKDGKIGLYDKDGNALSLQDLLKIGDEKTTKDPEMEKMEELRKIANNSGCRDTMNQLEASLELYELENHFQPKEQKSNTGSQKRIEELERIINAGCRDTMNQIAARQELEELQKQTEPKEQKSNTGSQKRIEELERIINSGCRDTMNQIAARQELEELQKQTEPKEQKSNTGCRDFNPGCRDTMNQMR